MASGLLTKETPDATGVASGRCERDITRAMKIEKYFDKQARKEMWRIDITISNRRHRCGKFTTRRDAEAAIAGIRLLAQANAFGLPSPLPPVTIDELLNKAEQKCTRPIQRNLIAMFRAVVDPQKPVTNLKRADMASFLETLIARELKAGTIAHYKQTLYSILNRAGEWFVELDDWYPPKFPRLEKPVSRQRVLGQEELVRLFLEWRRPECFDRESPKWRDYRLELYDLARLMLLTGARREELEKVSRASIQQREGWLNLQSTKTRRWHAIPLSHDARELLRNREGFQPMFRKFPASVIHYVCQRVANAANLPAGQHVAHGWTFHDFRRTAASYIESHGIAYSAVSATLGHRRQDVTAVYTPAQITEMRRASELLQSHWREIDETLQTPQTLWKLKLA